MISGSNEQLQKEFKYTLLKLNYHSWRISKMQSGRVDILEQRYTIKLCFKLWKMPQKRMECFRLLLDHLAWIKHQSLSGKRYFKEGRESVSDDERCWRCKKVNMASNKPQNFICFKAQLNQTIIHYRHSNGCWLSFTSLYILVLPLSTCFRKTWLQSILTMTTQNAFQPFADTPGRDTKLFVQGNFFL